MQKMPKVTKKTVKIFRAEDDISAIIEKAVADSGLSGKSKIFVKPNLSHPEYLPGVVTSPELIKQVVGLLRDGNNEVVVGESNGFNYPCWTAFDKTGVEAAVKAAGGTVINLSEDKVVEVKFPDGCPLKRLFLPKIVLDADAIVDLPLMKTHEFMVYSGAIKNLFGCVPSDKRIYLHPYLPEVFYRLYSLFKPQLTIMDARIGIEGNGPTKGKPVKMGLILTSNDALAVDLVAAKVMMIDWKDTYLSYVAKKTGFNSEEINIEGLQVTEVAQRFELPQIDLPVKAQIMIYQHEYLTKFFFCSLDIVRLFQKITMAYRGESTQIG
jgi:uncharacterized protein (DUF362 family)